MRPASSADQGSMGPPAGIEHRPPVCQIMLNGAPAARPARAAPGHVASPAAPPVKQLSWPESLRTAVIPTTFGERGLRAGRFPGTAGFLSQVNRLRTGAGVANVR